MRGGGSVPRMPDTSWASWSALLHLGQWVDFHSPVLPLGRRPESTQGKQAALCMCTWAALFLIHHMQGLGLGLSFLCDSPEKPLGLKSIPPPPPPRRPFPRAYQGVLQLWVRVM